MSCTLSFAHCILHGQVINKYQFHACMLLYFHTLVSIISSVQLKDGKPSNDFIFIYVGMEMGKDLGESHSTRIQ